MSANPTILLAEDDRAVRESLERAFRVNGYSVRSAKNGLEALALHAEEVPDLLVTDVMMPDLDGLTLCRRLRESGDQTPILVLTARDAIADRVAGLDAGADDYLPKPFALEELLARVRALLRRHGDSAEETLELGDLQLDLRARSVTRAGVAIDLTKTEFDLLELLLRNSGGVLGRDVIYERIWGYDFGTDSKSLDVYIGYLRRKTELNGASRLIHTVRGIGYVARVS